MGRDSNVDGPDDSNAPDFDGFPPEREGANLLGATSRGDPIYYDSADHELLEADANAGEAVWSDRRSLEAGTTVADLIDDIEARVGWNELSDYAKQLLSGAEDDHK